MTQIIFPLAIGLLLLGVMLYWLLHGDTSRNFELSNARDALAHLRSDFLPSNIVDRIFDHDDFAFVLDEKEAGLLRLLQAERKTVATYWLRHTRRQTTLVMSLYLKSARQSARLSVALELQIALNYLLFLTACNSLQSLIWLRGPARARKIAQQTMAAATRFCTVSEKMLTLAEARYAGLAKMSGPERPVT